MNTAAKNLWTLDKDDSIKTLLIMLQHLVGAEGFSLLDEELLNQKAVRIIPPNYQGELSAYVYSYAQSQGHYGLDLEFPYLIASAADDQTIRLNELTVDETLQNLIAHLELQAI